MNVEKLKKKYDWEQHSEGGEFVIRHYDYKGPGRAPSGSVYFYVYPDLPTRFHAIDCDEYWVHLEGSDLEIWVINPEKKLEVLNLGKGDNAEPMHFVRKGSVFASKHKKGETEGTMFSAITVPRYCEDSSLNLWPKEKVLQLCPEAKAFWE